MYTNWQTDKKQVKNKVMKTQILKSTKKVIVTLMIILTVSVTSIANAQGISAFIAMLSPAISFANTSNDACAVLDATSETDNCLAVEDWMSNDNYWTGSEQDSRLGIENWMTSNNYWGVNESKQISDNPLTIQNWMKSNNYWMGQNKIADNTLAVENWMTSNNYWGVK